MTRRLSLFAMFLFAPAILGQSLTVSEARQLTSLTYEPTDSIGQVAAASNGSDYLVAWTTGDGFVATAHAARISAQGVVLDPLGFDLPVSGTAKIFGVGTNFLVFGSQRASGVVVVSDRQLTTKPIPGDVHGNTPGWIISNGRNVLLVDHATNGEGNTDYVTLILIDSSGEVVSRRILLDLPSPKWLVVDVASDAAGYLLLLRSQDDFLATFHVSGDGTSTDSTPRRISPLVVDPALVSGDGETLMTWGASAGSPDRRVLRLRSDGSPNGPVSTVTVTGGAVVRSLSVQWSGSTYIIGAVDNDGKGWITSVDRQGMTIKSARALAGSPTSLALASNGVNVLVSTTKPGMESVLLAPTGEALAHLITINNYRPAVQRFPRGAYGDGVWLLVWQETSGLYAARVDRNGATLDARGILIQGGAVNEYATAATFDGRSFQIAWMSDGTLFLQAVSLAGLLKGAIRSFPTAPRDPYFSEYPILATNGSGQLFFMGSNDRQANLVDADGSVKVVPLTMLIDSATFTGSAYALMVSRRSICNRVPSYFQAEASMIRIRPDATVLDTKPVIVASRMVHTVNCFQLLSDFVWGIDTGLLVIASPPGRSAIGINQDLHPLWDVPLDSNQNDGTLASFDGRNFLIGATHDQRVFSLVAFSPHGMFLPPIPIPNGEPVTGIVRGSEGFALLLSAHNARIYTSVVHDSWTGDARVRVIRWR